MTTTRSLVAATASANFETKDVELRPLGANDVKIDIAFSGICHSDIHQVREEWFAGIFPMVPGHEIAGTVVEVGSAVTKFKVGDRAGIGTFVDSCRTCEYCLSGDQNYCLKGNVQTYNDGAPSYGGYAQQIVANADYVLHVPAGIELAEAAPLLCAGITVYAPLKRWGSGSGRRVAILGLGGLGHLAVKIAAAFGAEVTVLGRSLDKKTDALEFGAVDYKLTTAVIASQKNYFDIILNTTSADLDIDGLLGTLRVGGALVNVGLPGARQDFDPFAIIASEKVIAGSNTGGIAITQEMLDFCASHGIGSAVEILDASNPAAVDAAYDRVVNADVRYRFVIDASTI
jgi:uncharacterized zinc-type alcohol dehydrogenase-like protein